MKRNCFIEVVMLCPDGEMRGGWAVYQHQINTSQPQVLLFALPTSHAGWIGCGRVDKEASPRLSVAQPVAGFPACSFPAAAGCSERPGICRAPGMVF